MEVVSDKKMSGRAVFLTLFLCVLWGGLTPAVKVALRDLPPLALAAIRFGLACVVLWAWCRIRGIPLVPERGEWGPLAVMTLFFVTQIASINVGVKYTSAAHAIVFLYTYPLFAAVFAHWVIPGNRLTSPVILGLVLAFCGVAAIYVEGWGEGSGLGDGLSLLSGMLIGGMTVYMKVLLRRMELFKILVWEMALGVPIFFLGSLLLEAGPYRLTFPGAASIVYQSFGITVVGFVLWAYLLRQHQVAKFTSFFFSTPLIGIVLSHVALGEAITSQLSLGALLVAGGIYLANR